MKISNKIISEYIKEKYKGQYYVIRHETSGKYVDIYLKENITEKIKRFIYQLIKSYTYHQEIYYHHYYKELFTYIKIEKLMKSYRQLKIKNIIN